MEKQIKFVKPVIKAVDKENKRITAVISDNTIDRDNERFDTKGWDLQEYKKHPVLLSSHMYNDLRKQIGEGTKIRKEGNELVMEMEFYAGEGNPEADWAWKLAEKNMAMFSVGFMPKKWKTPKGYDGFLKGDEEFDPEKEPEGLQRIYTKQELLEVSQVLVGSNRNALQREVESEVLIKGIKDYAGEILEKIGGELPEEDGEKPEEEQDTMEEHKKRVIGYAVHGDGPKAAESEAWNAGREVREASVDDLKIMCAWYDAKAPDVKSSYKLPHHKAKGKAVVWRGVAAAMAALLGARGGVNIPSGDRKGVYNHLSRHYKQFDKEAPEFKEYSDGELKDMFEQILKEVDDENGTQEKIVAEIKVMDVEEVKTLIETQLNGISDMLDSLKTLYDVLDGAEVTEKGTPDKPEEDNIDDNENGEGKALDELLSGVKGLLEKIKE